MKKIVQTYKNLTKHDETLLIVALIIIMAVISCLTPYFFRSVNIINVLRQSSITLIAAIGMTLLILIGEIDLSVGSVSAFVAIFTVRTLNATQNIFISILVGLLIGVVVGAIISFIVNKYNIASLIVTLGMMSILRGVGYITTNSVAVQNKVPKFTTLGIGYIGPIPIPVIIALLLFLLFHFILNYTTFGRYIYATGENQKAAVVSGINVKKIKTICFILSSVLVALSAIILTSRVNSGQPNLAIGFEMTVISATILGGTSLKGGTGSLVGTLTGVLILAVLENGMVLMGVSSFYQDVVRGIVIIVAVIIDQERIKRKEKQLLNVVDASSTNVA